MDKKDKQQKGINIIDIAALLALLALAAALVFAFLGGRDSVGERVKVRYVLEVSRLQTEFCARPQANEAVFSGAADELIGRVESVSSVPASHVGVDRKGDLVTSEIDGYSTLYITVVADARKTNQGYAVGDTVINMGREIQARLPSLSCTASCISLEIIEE